MFSLFLLPTGVPNAAVNTQTTRSQVVLWYAELVSFKNVKRKCFLEFRLRRPSSLVIKTWAHRFAEGSSTKNQTQVFHVPPQKEELRFAIVGAFEADTHLSLGRAARCFGVSKHTVLKTIRQMRPYKLGLLYELLPSEYEKQLDFCRDHILWIANDP